MTGTPSPASIPTGPWTQVVRDAIEAASPAISRPDGTDWHEQYAYSLGLQAYVYGFPWLYLSQLQWLWTSQAGKALADAKGIFVPWAPINSFFLSPGLATPDNATGGSPNHDTLYAVAWLDVGAEPMIITVPAITDRFWCMQMVCIDSDNFAYIGSHITGNAAASYLVGGPGWHGPVPDGVRDVLPRSRTPTVLILGRTGVNDDADGGADLKKAVDLQGQYDITPLSAWPDGGDRPHPPPRADIPVGIDYNDPRGAWITMNRAMTVNPPGVAPGIDQADLLRLFATIGVGPGQRLEDQPSATLLGLRRAAVDGLAMLKQMTFGRGTSINNWTYPPRVMGRAGQASDFITRAALQALGGVCAHDPDQAVYLNTTLDADGNTLSSSGKYTLTFDPDEGSDFPPFDPLYFGFWSLTMYQVFDYNLVKGSNNYFINSYYPRFKGRADGKMTVLIQRDDPGTLPEGTYWLQTPDPNDPNTANWYLVLRVYVPGPEVALTQTWAPPPIIRVG